MRVNIETNIKFSKKTAVILAGVFLLLLAALAGYSHYNNRNPIPANIRQQISFSAVYPKNSSLVHVDQSSYNYLLAKETFSYTAKISGVDTVVSEQPAPKGAQENSVVYYQSLGLHPVAQINSKNGLVVLVNFYNAGNFVSQGQNAVLVKNNTLLIAHPHSDITAEQWKTFFDNLVISK